MAYLGTQPNDVKKNTGLYTPSEILQLTKDGSWGGSLELIEEKSISGVSSAIFTSIKENVYDVHFLEIIDFQPATDGTDCRIRFFESGVEESASVYQFAFQFGTAGGTFQEVVDTSESYLRATFNTGSATNEKAHSYNYFYNLGDSAKFSFYTHQNVLTNNNTDFNMAFGGGVLPQASTVDQIKLFNGSGNFSCTAKLYGVKQI
jgi:hypothetical protein